MGFIDFLKGILPESLLKVEDKRIILKDNSTLIIGDQRINDPKTVSKIYEEIKKYQGEETLPLQILHEDLIDAYLEYEKISLKEKESLKKLKKVLDLENNECILMARRVALAEEEGKEKSLIEELKKQLEENHPRKGKKVLNLINAGYFDDLILPFIEIYKSKFGEEKYIEKYQRFYEDILTFFPLAIFVANYTSKEKIEKELIKRLNLNIPFVRIHAIGNGNIEKVEEVISKMKIKEIYNTNDERNTTYSGLQAQTYEIKLKD